MESKHIDIHRMDPKIIVTEEPCFLLKRESSSFASVFIVQPDCGMQGYCHEMDAKIEVKEEPGSSSFASVFIVQPDCDIQGYYHEMDAKTEVKEEPGSLEGIPSRSDSEEIHVKDADIMQDSTSERDQNFMLPQSSRLDTEATGNYESDVISVGSVKGDLKLRKNSSLCHGKFNRNTAPKENAETLQVDAKTSNLPLGLQTHVEAHKSERKHKCNVCDMRFLTASHLKRHILIHTGIRSFKCDKCEKSFTISSNLSRHKLYHEGKRPYKCKYCEKSFTEASNLKTHNLIHEGKRPFKCNKCAKSCTTAANLKKHSLFHEGKRPHACEICDKSYILASRLKNHHRLIHGGKKPYKSDISKECFILGF